MGDMKIIIGVSEIVYGLVFIALNWRYRFGERYYYLVAINRSYFRAHSRAIGKAMDTQERLLERSLKVEVPKKQPSRTLQWLFYIAAFAILCLGITSLVNYRNIALEMVIPIAGFLSLPILISEARYYERNEERLTQNPVDE
jgi:hypothetical protein